MPALERKNRFNMLLSDDELLMLRLIGDAEGLTSSDTVRMLLRKTARELAKPKPLPEVLEEIRHRVVPLRTDERVFEGRRTVADAERKPITRAAQKAARKANKNVIA